MDSLISSARCVAKIYSCCAHSYMMVKHPIISWCSHCTIGTSNSTTGATPTHPLWLASAPAVMEKRKVKGLEPIVSDYIWHYAQWAPPKKKIQSQTELEEHTNTLTAIWQKPVTSSQTRMITSHEINNWYWATRGCVQTPDLNPSWRSISPEDTSTLQRVSHICRSQ